MLGLAPVRDAVHAVEDVFRAPPAEWPQPLLDRLFESAAALRRAVEQAGREGQEEALERLSGIRLEAAPASAPPLPRRETAPAPTAPITAEAETPSEPPETTPATAAVAPEPAAPEAGSELLRVPFAKLDALVARITELVELGSGLEHLTRAQRAALDSAGLWRPLTDRIERLARISGELRSAVMELRLVPVARVFSRFPSLVRELAREQDKRVQVVLEGENTELDKSTVDVLGEPLLHLVRNAVDHGLERPGEREAAGKPAEGTLWLRAAQTGDRVRIEVEDDGRGLDRAAIRRRAVELELIDPDAELDREEMEALIFHPGFSTRRRVSTVSGRGVGLDVVVRSIMRLRGSLAVEPGAAGGTRFVLHLPLTLLVIPALLFESEGETLALPVQDIEEMLRPRTREYVGGAEVIHHDGELVPLARPVRLFGWPAPSPAPQEEPSGGSRAESGPYAIVVRRGGRAAAVAADRLIEQRDVVVRALPAYLGQPHGISGATIAPGGRVVLLLDPGGLIELNLDSHRRDRRAR